MKINEWTNRVFRSKIASLLVLGLAAGGVYLMASGGLGSCGTGGCGLTQARADLPPVFTAAHAPWSFADPRGGRISSEDFYGDVVVVAFWATWCPPCRKEIPELAALHKTFKGQGVRVLGVSLDELPDKELVAKAEKLGVTYGLARSNGDIPGLFGEVSSIPTVVVLDREGRPAHRHVGFVSGEQLEANVRSLL